MDRLKKRAENLPSRIPTVVMTTLVLALICTAAQAQSFTIRLLNAKSGKIMRNKNVTITWDVGHTDSVIHIGQDGLGHSDVPAGAINFVILGGPRIGKEPGRIAFFNCNGDSRDMSSYVREISTSISVSQLLKEGVVLKNGCGKKTFPSRPGELVFWALPRPWWEPDFQ
jgi:hypothetical protein